MSYMFSMISDWSGLPAQMRTSDFTQVSRIILTWTNYLYTLLGSVCVWLLAADVKSNLPEEFTDFPDTQVIIDCTEIRCQTLSSPLLQSEMYSNCKSHCTMKGLIGIAPHGPVTFVAQLYAGSVSDREIFKQCGITKRLTEDMAVMADKGFLISDCVSCKVYCPPNSLQVKADASTSGEKNTGK